MKWGAAAFWEHVRRLLDARSGAPAAGAGNQRRLLLQHVRDEPHHEITRGRHKGRVARLRVCTLVPHPARKVFDPRKATLTKEARRARVAMT